MNTQIARALSALAIAGTLFGGAWLGTAAAHADPSGTVNLSDIDVDQFPECVEEDCSDQPGQVGMWLDEDTGTWYLSLSESVYFVVTDDTAAAHAHDPFSQDTFPCAEDEVLGYAPEFGPDRVGCIHVEGLFIDGTGNAFANPTSAELAR